MISQHTIHTICLLKHSIAFYTYTFLEYIYLFPAENFWKQAHFIKLFAMCFKYTSSIFSHIWFPLIQEFEVVSDGSNHGKFAASGEKYSKYRQSSLWSMSIEISESCYPMGRSTYNNISKQNWFIHFRSMASPHLRTRDGPHKLRLSYSQRVDLVYTWSARCGNIQHRDKHMLLGNESRFHCCQFGCFCIPGTCSKNNRIPQTMSKMENCNLPLLLLAHPQKCYRLCYMSGNRK